MIKVNGREVEFERFPNGELKLIEDSIDKIMLLLHPRVSFKYENDSDLIKLMFVKRYLDSLSKTVGDNAVLNIYYMPYSRMDRSEDKLAFTLKYVAEFINSLNFRRATVVEPHSDVTPALLDNAESRYINFDLLPKVMEEVGFLKDYDYLFFPDAGAQKRYGNIKGFNQLVGYKNRDFKTGEIKKLEVIGDKPHIGTNPSVIIVDDLSSYGGTFIHSAIALRELGFEKVYLLVAHAENSIFKGELFGHINKVFTTDSILTEQNYPHHRSYEKQLKVYDIEELIK